MLLIRCHVTAVGTTVASLLHYQIHVLGAISKKPVVKEMVYVTVAASFVWMVIQSKAMNGIKEDL